LRARASYKFMFTGLAALALTLLAGVFTALFYIPAFYPFLRRSGLEMPATHSLHTAFAIAWIFCTATGVMYRMMEDADGGMTRTEKRLANAHFALWCAAGAGIAVSLPLGLYSGREYMEYSPWFALPILAGWLSLAAVFLVRARAGFWERPVYMHMWGVALLLFVYSFAENNLWPLGFFKGAAVADMQVQWKSLGTFFGAMNLCVYGCALYISERIAENTAYAQSRTAFALFWVGLLSTFTNYGHHTYHLPQNEAIKWVSFITSMLEIVILVKVLSDIVGMIRERLTPATGAFSETLSFLKASKIWTAINFIFAIAISVPPVNALIHGTRAVTAHAMGAMIGIDGFILFAATSWFVESFAPKTKATGPLPMIALQAGLAGLFTALILGGGITGFCRYTGQPLPRGMQDIWTVFALAGAVMAAGISIFLYRWIKQGFLQKTA
ncbi:MAG: cbb3-type cytochrome c oxidase subunit I, partial [Alphaproteobacteria bacterium]|nr:cbb3-type cytochrome c oxidase subunit I [Alphaproteobacteria bacterium]